MVLALRLAADPLFNRRIQTPATTAKMILLGPSHTLILLPISLHRISGSQDLLDDTTVQWPHLAWKAPLTLLLAAATLSLPRDPICLSFLRVSEAFLQLFSIGKRRH